MIQHINSNKLEGFLVYWAAYFTLKNERLFQSLKKIKFARDDEARAKTRVDLDLKAGNVTWYLEEEQG